MLIIVWNDTYHLVGEINSLRWKVSHDPQIMNNLDADYVTNLIRKIGSLKKLYDLTWHLINKIKTMLHNL